MDIEEYNQLQQQLVNELSNLLLILLRPFLSPALTTLEWAAALRAIFPEVASFRRRSAELGRAFYDAQRDLHVGSRHDVLLTDYKFEWFEEAMRPSREAMRKPGATEEALGQMILRVAKEVENGGRRTILRAVETDRSVKGWARVATGRETCAFCMMMVSRGPVYLSAESAGLDADDTTAQQLWEEGDEAALNELAKRWHPGCDCKVVPVFDRKNWPGRDAYLEAERLWIKATKGYRGKDALNALRRAIEENKLNPADIAAA